MIFKMYKWRPVTVSKIEKKLKKHVNFWRFLRYFSQFLSIFLRLSNFCWIENNFIHFWPKWNFQNLTSTKFPYFPNKGSNQLSNLTPTTFKGLSHLRVLSLSLNNLQVLDQHAFTPIASTLAHLDLSYNFLRSIPKQALSTLAQLQTLNLANNHIIDIGEDSIAPASPILSTLHTLNLESNELTTVQLPAFQNLTFISFNNNRLSFLSHAMFSALDEATIEELRFEYNEISFIDTDTFSGFAALKSLDISGNRLARIKPDIFKTVCLESLYLARNPVSLYMISQRREVNCIRLDACNSDRHLVPIKGKTFVYKRNEK